jgi:hypothetical protein
MAITLVGSTITIDSGVASGTATGGSANTLTGTGFSTTWAGRIVWITSGTGAGQSRFIRTATATTLTVEPNWDVVPTSGSVFSIGYTWADVDAALAGVTVSSANFYLVPFSLSLTAGGFIGSINEHVRFTLTIPTLTTALGSLWQQGRLFASGVGCYGGTVEINYAGGTFNDQSLSGMVRWYRTLAFATPANGSYRFNEASSGAGLDLRDCTFTNVYVVARGVDRIERCTLASRPFWPKGATSPVLSESSYIENSFIISGDSGAGENSHYFGLEFQGIPPDGTFSRPYWVWNTTIKEGTYFWDTAATAFASTFAASYWYPGTPSGAGFHTGYTVNLSTRLAAGGAAPSTVVGLWDNAENAAWMEGVNSADGRPVNSLTITTNASGNYANPHPAVAGKSGLVVAQRLKSTGATQYGPWTVRARKYGYLEAGGARSYTNGATETLFMVVDAAITQANGSIVAAYTEIDTSAKLYDRYQHHLSLAANIKTDNGLTRSGSLINAGAYNVVIDATAASAFALAGNTITIKASAFTGDMTTTGLITLANGATFVGTRTDANGTIAPPKTVSVTGLTAGSRLRIYNNTTATEVVNQIVAGTSYTATYNEGTGYTTGNTLTITATWQSGATAKLPFSTQVVVGSTGWSALVTQQDDTVYNTTGLDGSTVTEFAPDYPSVQVDISDPNGQTSVDRLYAWFVATTTTADGIRNWIGGIVAEDAGNFRVVTSILNLKLDNLSATGVEFTGGLRLYRDDNVSPLVSSTTGGGSITLFAGKVYTSVVSTASPVITGDISQVPAAVQTGMTAQGYTTTRAAKLDNADVATSTRLAAASYTTPPTVSAIRTEIDTNSTKLDVAVGTRLAAASYTTPPTAAANATAVRSELTTELGRIDATVSSRLASASYTAPDNAAITAIKTKTDNLPSDPADESSIQAAIAAIPAAPSASSVANAVRTELTTELGRIDVATSTRLASSGYTAPANADISAIKAKTDNLPSDPASTTNINNSETTLKKKIIQAAMI